MRIIADLHIHGRYSRATSEQMSIPEIGKFAKIKGLNLVGTGDFTHPAWLKEIKETLLPEQDTGLFKLADSPAFHAPNGSVHLITENRPLSTYSNT
jgi:PHP family Zn ribbon phosphoesterase